MATRGLATHPDPAGPPRVQADPVPEVVVVLLVPEDLVDRLDRLAGRLSRPREIAGVVALARGLADLRGERNRTRTERTE